MSVTNAAIFIVTCKVINVELFNRSFDSVMLPYAVKNVMHLIVASIKSLYTICLVTGQSNSF